MKRIAERGFTLVEIMIVVAIIALLAAIAIPNVLRGRTTANESAAIGNIRALVSSLEMERSVNQLYPDSTGGGVGNFRDAMYGATCAAGIGPDPDFGPPSFCNAAAAGLTAFGVQGYNYTYANGATAGATYRLSAVPQTTGTTGTRGFFANESGLVRHCPCTAGAACVVTAANGPAMATIDQGPDMDTATAGIQNCS